MHAVIDTNVVISGVISPRSTAAFIVGLVATGDIVVCYNESIIAEYRNVARYPKLARYRIDIDAFERFLEGLADNGEYVSPPFLRVDMPDEDDRRFYEISCDTGCPIITRNHKDFPNDAFLVDPSFFARTMHATSDGLARLEP
ncbi:putative toxin-antitoxin system toxin component, PIN family [Gordonibacter sp. 28C]|uniref:putative toxin-antitoxin system toxin component, PIN family n=1 Tax=Gordonibacter sp. 28C TaxID=2078569 RepID=UPI001314AC65|nr:putative toxin-antitoxin system toxin component, PIN family [Gordonibacter sp. 28C]